jgi:hypothetical protein
MDSAKESAKIRLEEAEWWADRIGTVTTAEQKRLAACRAAAEAGKPAGSEKPKHDPNCRRCFGTGFRGASIDMGMLECDCQPPAGKGDSK